MNAAHDVRNGTVPMLHVSRAPRAFTLGLSALAYVSCASPHEIESTDAAAAADDANVAGDAARADARPAPPPGDAGAATASATVELSSDRTVFGVWADASPSGRVAIAAQVSGEVRLGDRVLTLEPATTGGLVALLDPDGRVVWARALRGAAPTGVAIDDESDEVVTGGMFFSTPRGPDIGGAPLAGAGDWDAWSARYDLAGEPRWARRDGGPGDDRTTAMDVRGGRTRIAGYANASAQVGDLRTNDGELRGAFVIDLDERGDVGWTRLARGPAPAVAEPASLMIGDDGSTTVGGYVSSRVDFGAGPVDGRTVSLFVARWDASGQIEWATPMPTGGGGVSTVSSVAPDGANGAYATGWFRIEINAGGTRIASADPSMLGGSPSFWGDLFLVHFDARGTVDRVRAHGSFGDDRDSWLLSTGARTTWFARLGGDVEHDLGSGRVGAGPFVTDLDRTTHEPTLPVRRTGGEVLLALRPGGGAVSWTGSSLVLSTRD